MTASCRYRLITSVVAYELRLLLPAPLFIIRSCLSGHTSASTTLAILVEHISLPYLDMAYSAMGAGKENTRKGNKRGIRQTFRA
ncbi:hypothetical protein F5Y09DRAFT_302211 [Xylaria sp. FL1042]|nr:hypothetical protein F5Y09DRAFT_302211 [Xylaria sp. FL1042]